MAAPYGRSIMIFSFKLMSLLNLIFAITPEVKSKRGHNHIAKFVNGNMRYIRECAVEDYGKYMKKCIKTSSGYLDE